MIRTLRVYNILSYRNDQIFNFEINELHNIDKVAHYSTNQNQDTDNTDDNNVNISNFVMIFGKNNSGKTSILRIIKAIKNFVITGNNTLTPYRSTSHNISEFEIEFIVDSATIRYGAVFHGKTIISEWMYATHTMSQREVAIFLREDSKLERAYLNIASHIELIASSSKKEDLYLFNLLNLIEIRIDDKHVSKEIDFSIFSEINEFLRSLSKLENVEDILNTRNLARLHNSQQLQASLNEQIKRFDLNILEVGFEKVNSGKQKNIESISNSIKYNIVIVPEAPDYTNEYKHLSYGTKKIILYIIACLICDKKIFLIDDIEHGLHPHAFTSLMDIITTKANKTRIQFVATSHALLMLDNTNISNDTKILLENTSGTEVSCVSDYDPFTTEKISTRVSNGRLPGSPIIVT